MKNKIVEMFSKLNKGFKYILGINIVFFGIIFLLDFSNILDGSKMFFVILGVPLLAISQFVIPFVMIYTSPKFTKKEKKNFILYYVYMIVFFVILLALTKNIIIINILSLLNVFYYLFYTSYLFWTHRKNDYRIEENKIKEKLV